MCLLNIKLVPAPYRAGNIRWKIAIQRDRHLKAYYRPIYYQSNVWMKAFGNKNDPTVFGFHVFVTRKEARRFKRFYTFADDENVKLIKVHVRGHLQSGIFCGLRSETWKEMKIAPRLKSKSKQ